MLANPNNLHRLEHRWVVKGDTTVWFTRGGPTTSFRVVSGLAADMPRRSLYLLKRVV